MSLAWHDGKFVEKSAVTVSPADFGFQRGIGIYELTRVYAGVPFRLADHLDRFEHSVKAFDIGNPYARDEIARAVAKLTAENRFAHSAIKFYMTVGECGRPNGASFAACDGFTPHLMIFEDEVRPDHPEAPYGLERYRRGQRLKSVAHNREFPTVKSTNYAPGFVAARLEAGKEWDDVLFTRLDGCVTEATRSNFFCVIDGVLCTAKEGMLFGITRKILLELAGKLGIPVAERDFTVTDLARATEAFTTGSIAEMVPARQIDDHIMPMVMDGPVFVKLRGAFSGYIEDYCRACECGIDLAPVL